MTETPRPIQDCFLIPERVLKKRPPRDSDVEVDKATHDILAAVEKATSQQIAAVMIEEKSVGPGRNTRKAFLKDDRPKEADKEKPMREMDTRMEAVSSALASIMMDNLMDDPKILSSLPKSVKDGRIEFEIPLSQCNTAGIGGFFAYFDAGMAMRVEDDGTIDTNLISKRPTGTVYRELKIVSSQRDVWLKKMLLMAKMKFIQQFKGKLKIKGTLMIYDNDTSREISFEGLDLFDCDKDKWVMGSNVTFDPVEAEKVNVNVCLKFIEKGSNWSRGAVFDIETLEWKNAKERTV